MNVAAERFVRETGVRIEANNVAERRDKNPHFRNAIHFEVTMFRGDSPFWRGEYSCGIGTVYDWIAETQNKVVKVWDRVRLADLPRLGARSMTLHQEETLSRATIQFRKAAPIRASDVIVSLMSDASGSDLPFEEWARDMGMSDDSISAKETWEACNDTRRRLNSAFSSTELGMLSIIAAEEDPYADEDEGIGGPS